MMPGMPEQRTHDYLRHGTTSLFAAFNTADGSVISSTHRRHRAIEFKKFLGKIDTQVPEHLDVHLIADNYGTHKSPAIRSWLDRHPRFHMHHTPTYASWINQVERWFAYLTQDLLQRSDHRSVQALERDIRAWVKAWNENPQPFIWTKTAEEILTSIQRLLQRINGAGHWSLLTFPRRAMRHARGAGLAGPVPRKTTGMPGHGRPASTAHHLASTDQRSTDS